MKYYCEKTKCIVCGFVGIDLHHIKTRKAGGCDDSSNLMPICHLHHVEVHNIGMNAFSRKNGYFGVKMWLKRNGWEYDTILNKWFNDKEKLE